VSLQPIFSCTALNTRLHPCTVDPDRYLSGCDKISRLRHEFAHGTCPTHPKTVTISNGNCGILEPLHGAVTRSLLDLKLHDPACASGPHAVENFDGNAMLLPGPAGT
jgi:hypothetical protein